MNPDTMKLPVVFQQTVDATAPAENNHKTPTALGPQLEDPPRAATATAVATAALVAAAEAAAAAAHHMALAEELVALAEELVAVAIAEAEATQTAMPPATHVAATMPATKLMKFVAKRLLKQTTATTSLPTPLDFATCSPRRNSSLSGSRSTT
jgi:hypothetical protein